MLFQVDSRITEGLFFLGPPAPPPPVMLPAVFDLAPLDLCPSDADLAPAPLLAPADGFPPLFPGLPGGVRMLKYILILYHIGGVSL